MTRACARALCRRLRGAVALRPALALLLLALVLSAPQIGAAKPRGTERRRVNVKVVEIAGGRAYLSPGEKRHVRVGDRVRIGGHVYPVLASNADHAVIAAARARLKRGQRGFVMVQPRMERTFATRAAPRPLSAFTAAWSVPRLPADAQRPRFVPLGVMSDTRHDRALLSVEHQRIQPLSGAAFAIGRTRLRAALHARLSALPLHIDADGFSELWQASDLNRRPENASRPLLNVRQLQLSYQGETVQASAGRLRHAARTLGMLDGARASATLSPGWTLAAFGGALPDPLDSSFATEASRFGAELGWRDDGSTARPSASLTLQGSRFEGRTDERRVTGVFEAFPALGRLGARAEVSFFDADNPWGAAATELTELGGDVALRLGSLRLGLALDMRRPERSRWLQSFLPRGYFCVERPVAGAFGAEPCVGGQERYSTALNAGWEADLWSLDAGGTFATTRRSEDEQGTLFATFRRREIAGALRFDAGASLSRGSLLESAAIQLGLGTPVASDAGDLSVYYRPSLGRYGAEANTFVDHGLGARLWWAVRHDLDVNVAADVVTGRDVDVLFLHLGAAYRPRF